MEKFLLKITISIVFLGISLILGSFLAKGLLFIANKLS